MRPPVRLARMRTIGIRLSDIRDHLRFGLHRMAMHGVGIRGGFDDGTCNERTSRHRPCHAGERHGTIGQGGKNKQGADQQFHVAEVKRDFVESKAGPDFVMACPSQGAQAAMTLCTIR